MQHPTLLKNAGSNQNLSIPKRVLCTLQMFITSTRSQALLILHIIMILKFAKQCHKAIYYIKTELASVGYPSCSKVSGSYSAKHFQKVLHMSMPQTQCQQRYNLIQLYRWHQTYCNLHQTHTLMIFKQGFSANQDRNSCTNPMTSNFRTQPIMTSIPPTLKQTLQPLGAASTGSVTLIS